MSRYALVVFDWDGTLSDSASQIVAAIQGASRDTGLREPTETQARYIIGLGLRDAMEYLFPGLEPERYGQVAERYKAHYVQQAHAIALFAGVLEGLQSLKSRGKRIAVATGKSRNGLDAALSAHQLVPVFDGSRCADESLPKPDPAMLHYLLKRFGVAPENALMVGDTTHDLAMARAAGVDALAVSYGAHTSDLLRQVEHRALVETPEELWQWLRING